MTSIVIKHLDAMGQTGEGLKGDEDITEDTPVEIRNRWGESVFYFREY